MARHARSQDPDGVVLGQGVERSRGWGGPGVLEPWPAEQWRLGFSDVLPPRLIFSSPPPFLPTRTVEAGPPTLDPTRARVNEPVAEWAETEMPDCLVLDHDPDSTVI